MIEYRVHRFVNMRFDELEKELETFTNQHNWQLVTAYDESPVPNVRHTVCIFKRSKTG